MIVSEIMKHSRSDVEHFDQNYYVKKKDGEVRHIHASIVMIRNMNNKVTHLDGYLVDITDWNT